MLNGIHKIHLIGIAGSGMRAIANILICKGYEVSGSDLAESSTTEKFRSMGATIHIGHDASYVNGVDAVVRSTAIREDNPELKAAREQGITVLHRSDIVKAVLDVTDGIAVAGAHGKTSTTSMIGQILVEGEVDPTVIIGGEVDYLKGSSCLGKGKFSIVEADESDGSFLKLRPKAIVITNIENDHMDHYKTMENLLKAFCEFVETLPVDGKAVVCGDNDKIQYVMTQVNRQFITYGLDESNDYVAKNIHYQDSTLVYDVYHKDTNVARINLRVPGQHNVLNSLAAFIIGHEYCEVSIEDIQKGLGKFIGAKRRFETKGHVAGVWVIDDYAHNPAKCAASIKACQPLAEKVVAWFQPHGYGPTRFLRKDFVEEISAALRENDEIWMSEIFYAGGTAVKDISANDLIEDIKAKGKKAYFVEDRNQFLEIVRPSLSENSVLLLMGARDPSLEEFCKDLYEKL